MSTARETNEEKKDQVKETNVTAGLKAAKNGRKKAGSTTVAKKTTRTKASTAKKTTKASSAKKNGLVSKATTRKTTTKRATTAKKTTRKTTGKTEFTDGMKKVHAFIQFAGKDIPVHEIIYDVLSRVDFDSCKDIVEIYIQPENGVAYYAVDGNGGEDFKVEI